jgi:hypothetical protein
MSDLSRLDEEQIDPSSGRSLPFRILNTRAISSSYANMVQVSFDGAMFHVQFGQFDTNYVEDPFNQAGFHEQGFYPAEAVTKLLLTPQMIDIVISNLRFHADLYRSSTAVATEGGDAHER